MNLDSKNRWTIQQAKESQLFGETLEARVEFFKNLEAQAQRFTVFSEDNLHQLLGDELWRIYAAVQQIDGLLHAGDISKDSAEAIQETIVFLADKLSEMIDQYQGSSKIKNVLMHIEKNIFREKEEQTKMSATKDSAQDEKLKNSLLELAYSALSEFEKQYFSSSAHQQSMQFFIQHASGNLRADELVKSKLNQTNTLSDVIELFKTILARKGQFTISFAPILEEKLNSFVKANLVNSAYLKPSLENLQNLLPKNIQKKPTPH